MMVLVLTGLPGTGKSTLAELVARRLPAPAFAGDWLFGAMTGFGLFANIDGASYKRLYHGLLWTLASRQLMLDQSAVLDCLVDDAIVAEWTEQAESLRGRLVVVECFCSDEELHRRRLEGRRRDIPGWHEIGWDHVERMRVEYPPLSSTHLRVDAMNPLRDNVEAVLDLFG